MVKGVNCYCVLLGCLGYFFSTVVFHLVIKCVVVDITDRGLDFQGDRVREGLLIGDWIFN